jgi:hypothetical protein
MSVITTSQPVKAKRTDSISALFLVIGILFGTSLAFMLVQNSTHAVGGHISLPKALWLDWTLTIFYVVPFFLWRNEVLASAVRSLFGWLLLSFTLRGVAELVVIYATHAWRCIDGISHNALTLALAMGLVFLLPRNLAPADSRAVSFLPVYVVTLLFESLNAWQFSLLANPAKGVYFAADTPHFAFVNNLTWVELACVWPWFCWFLWRTRADFSQS